MTLSLILVLNFLTANRSGMITGDNCYLVRTYFNSASGVQPGARIKISGVVVGKVKSIKLDEDYKAVVDICIKHNIPIPTDSTASIIRESLIGEKYIKIDPGSDASLIEDGGEIKNTQSAINFESIIGRLLSSYNPFSS